ncbi:hypothetical protein Pan44_28130 [Caulifigura coniformis]|uniref:Uncharacterized protein n=1 Tax=Caulifigura coniformis TaxID=2527983 RepID=A0A517SF69_9PLAN|nr:hypothetical protein [Caulifigura coniformis]QDT54776.1 hypothetical protein Pan44_28130 [Caulifigura coniformis]
MGKHSQYTGSRGGSTGSGGSGGPGGRNVGRNRREMERKAFKPVPSSKLTDWDVKAFNASRVTERTNVEELDWPVEPEEGFAAIFDALEGRR